MAKKVSKKWKASGPTLSSEISKLDDLIVQLDGYAVPTLNQERSVEECRQLNDMLEHVHLEAIAIDTPTLYTEYGSFLRRIKGIQDKLELQRKDEKESFLVGGRLVDAKFKGFAGIALRLRGVFDKAMTVWDRAQESIRRAEEAKLREEARKEREKLEKQAEARAKRLEKKGQDEEAAEVRESVPEVPIPTVAPSNVPKVSGVSKTKRWSAEISAEGKAIQRKRLVMAIDRYNAAFPDSQIIPPEYWELDEQKISAMARTLKGTLSLPNVKVIEGSSRSVRV